MDPGGRPVVGLHPHQAGAPAGRDLDTGRADLKWDGTA
jgi:hypothetical protein